MQTDMLICNSFVAGQGAVDPILNPRTGATILDPP